MKYHYLEAFTEKYNKALNSGTKEFRITTIEAGLLLQDITHLSTSSIATGESNTKLTAAVEMLTEILKKMLEEDSGTF